MTTASGEVRATFSATCADDLGVGLDEVHPAHARLARQAGGDDDDVGVLGALVGAAADADDLGLEALDRPRLVHVQREALGLALDDVGEHDGLEDVVLGETVSGGGAVETGADDGDLALPGLLCHGRQPIAGRRAACARSSGSGGRGSSARSRSARAPPRRAGRRPPAGCGRRGSRPAAPGAAAAARAAPTSASPMTTSPLRQCSKVTSSSPTPDHDEHGEQRQLADQPGEERPADVERRLGVMLGVTPTAPRRAAACSAARTTFCSSIARVIGPTPPGFGRHEPGDVHDVEGDVPGDLAVHPADADVEDGGARLDHVGGDQARARRPRRRRCRPSRTWRGQVAGAGVAQRHGGVLGAAGEQQPERPADGDPAADDDDLGAGDRHVVAAQQLHDADRRARQRRRGR